MTEKFCTSQEAIEYLMTACGYSSYYALAKDISRHGTTIQTTQIKNYARGQHKMGEATAEYFYTVYGVTITDVYVSEGSPTVWK